MELDSTAVNQLIYEYFLNEGLNLCAKAMEAETNTQNLDFKGGDSELVNLLLKGIKTKQIEEDVVVTSPEPEISSSKLNLVKSVDTKARFVAQTSNYFIFTVSNGMQVYDHNLALVHEVPFENKQLTYICAIQDTDSVIVGLETGAVINISIGAEIVLGKPFVVSYNDFIKRIGTVVSGKIGYALTNSGKCRTFDVRLGTELNALDQDGVQDAEFLNEHTLGYTAENKIYILDLVTESLKKVLETESPVLCLNFDISSQTLICGTLNGTVCAWNANSEIGFQLRVGNGDGVLNLVQCGANYAAVTLASVHLFNRNGELIKSLHTGLLRFVRASKYVVIATEAEFLIYTLDLKLISTVRRPLLDAVWVDNQLLAAGESINLYKIDLI